jgi:frataxin-like iron-binding protein CyaY
MKKSKFTLLFMVLLFSLIMPYSINSSNIITANAATIKINKKKAELNVGDSIKLKIIGTKSKVVWKSSDADVATVNSKGNVNAIEEGLTTITATVNNKHYNCDIIVESYGSISGSVTWQYNDFIGTKPDTGAYIALIPMDIEELEGKDHDAFSLLLDTKGEDGIYTIEVDGNGEYVMNDIPAGEYGVLIVSKNTTSGLRFDDEKAWNSIIDGIVSTFLSEEQLENLKTCIGYNSINFNIINIKANKTNIYSHDFGNTYL